MTGADRSSACVCGVEKYEKGGVCVGVQCVARVNVGDKKRRMERQWQTCSKFSLAGMDK